MHLIGISGYQNETRSCVNTTYVNALTRPGYAAVIIPQFVVQSREFLTLDKFKADFKGQIDVIVDRLDGYCMSGGRDWNPVTFGHTNYAAEGCDIIRDYTELALLEAFIAAEKPVIGICRGAQGIGLFLGLSNFQQHLAGHELHQQIESKMDRPEPCHRIWTRGAFRTYMSSKLGVDAHELSVNSMHHEAFSLTPNGKNPDKKDITAHGNFSGWYNHTVAAYEAKHGIKLLATTPTIIEAFEKPEAKLFCAQFHPEEHGPQGLTIQYWLDSYVV